MKPNTMMVMIAIGCLFNVTHAAMVVVAPADAPENVKAKADLVCDGQDDQVELLASITQAPRVTVEYDRNPGEMRSFECYGKYSIEWLPGDYHLSGTLVVPDAADMIISARAAHFYYEAEKGNAVVIQGSLRSLYSLGIIHYSGDEAALRIKPTKNMPTLSSDIFVRGLIGKKQRGTGLYIDPSVENVCINRIEAIDIYGFDYGVRVDAANQKTGRDPGHGKCDGNWWWVSNNRRCNTCYMIAHRGVDSNVWNINVDASIPGSVGLRTAELYGKYYLIMGTWQNEGGNKTIVLEPGAAHNVIEVHPPLKVFLPEENNSGNDTNIILTTERPPLTLGKTKSRKIQSH